jgi:transcriptional regulator with XRE-family HTH domain
MRVRRTALQVEAARRLAERRSRIGASVRQMRLARRWTQRELGRRAGLSRLVVGRIERGEGVLDVERLERVSIALGVPLAVGFDRDPHHEPADAGHLALQEILLRLAPGGYERDFELPTRPNEPWRSADVGLWAARWRTAVDAECWNTFGDIGAATRSSRRKLVDLEALAISRWGVGARSALVWVVRDTVRNRAVIARYSATFAAFFTGSSRKWVDALALGAEPPRQPGLVWCDVATGRLHEWRRPRGT